jgi:hypothetical protein
MGLKQTSKGIPNHENKPRKLPKTLVTQESSINTEREREFGGKHFKGISYLAQSGVHLVAILNVLPLKTKSMFPSPWP